MGLLQTMGVGLATGVPNEGVVCSRHGLNDVSGVEIIKQKQWDVNPKGVLGCLYLLGKVKSLQRDEWPWRGICAVPSPFLLKRRLRVGAKAMTRLLRYPGDKIPCNFFSSQCQRRQPLVACTETTQYHAYH